LQHMLDLVLDIKYIIGIVTGVIP